MSALHLGITERLTAERGREEERKKKETYDGNEKNQGERENPLTQRAGKEATKTQMEKNKIKNGKKRRYLRTGGLCLGGANE